jgi:hypothetical protein
MSNGAKRLEDKDETARANEGVLFDFPVGPPADSIGDRRCDRARRQQQEGGEPEWRSEQTDRRR